MKNLAKIGEAPARNRFRAVLEIEHFHRNETRVTNFLKGRGDWFEIHRAKTRPFQIGIIRMEMREVRPGLPNDLRDRRCLRGHRLHVQNDFEMSRRQSFNQGNRISGGIDEVCLRRPQRLKTHNYFTSFSAAHRITERLDGPISALLEGHIRQEIALFGRANDHSGSSDIGAKLDEVAKVFRRSFTNASVRMIQVEALGFNEHPMNSRDLDSVSSGRITQSFSFSRRDVGDGAGQRERRDLHRVVTELGRISEYLVNLPALKNLVADAEVHARQSSRSWRRVQVETVVQITRMPARRQWRLTLYKNLGRAWFVPYSLPMVHVGIGYDVHALVEGRKLILGGVTIPHSKGLEGHSDADVLMHAICDALLGALGEADIGHFFPNTDARWRGAASKLFLHEAARLTELRQGKIVNIDATVIAQAPKIFPLVQHMKRHIAEALGINEHRVGIKATTNEHLGFLGREEGIAAMAVASVDLPVG